MATVIKKKKDTKMLDEFLSITERTFLVISDNWQKFSLALAIVVVCAVSLLYLQQSRNRKRIRMFREIARVERVITPNNRESVVKELRRIVDDFSGVDGVVYAQYSLARQDLFGGHANEGENMLETIKTKYPGTLFARLANLDLGYQMEFSGNCDKALGYYETIIKKNIFFARANAYLGSGRCLERAGEKEDAVKSYQEFIQQFPGHPSLEFAKTRVRSLENGLL